MQLAFILGRLPELARQEVESVATILPFQWSLLSLQANILVLKPINGSSVETLDETSLDSQEFKDLQVQVEKLQHRLGGTIKIVYLFQQVQRAAVASTAQKLVMSLQKDVEGKRAIGISIYGNSVVPIKLGMTLKKQLKTAGESLRIVLPQDAKELNSAQLYHNKLTLQSGPAALELNVIEGHGSAWLGVTATAQDIEFYTKRDFHIPHPDPVSGMLPPKLAQTMVNLATGTEEVTVYDPFCGNGRVVLEAWLMGHNTYGSDIVEKKVWSASENLKWLSDGEVKTDQFWVADATKPESINKALEYITIPYVIVGEPYLGKPLRDALDPRDISVWLDDTLPTYKAFLETWAKAPENERPAQMLLVFPRAKVANGTEVSVYDSLVDDISRLGYSSTVRYCYDRPDSYVRRDLVLLNYKK